jgi:exonuclease SbcD
VRFLHSSDWHIGRTVRGRSRDAEHQTVLQELLTLAREHAVDCLLVAGDLFETSTPSAESERLLYSFLQELHGLRVPAVLIAGNHDHPRRFDAIAPLLRVIDIHALGWPRGPADGGVIELPSRDGRETAVIAALPWVPERQVLDFGHLQQAPAVPLTQYAERVQEALAALAASFRADTVNVLLAHVLADGAIVGPGGGERALHMAWNIYGVNPQALPEHAQYAALGHVHKGQEVRKSAPAAWYSGSLLQLDFGEREQEKYVNLVDLHPGRPAEVTQLPVAGGRRLVDVGGPNAGVPLNDLPRWRDESGDAWLRVFVDVEMPVANLTALVRQELPNAVHVQRVQPRAASADPLPRASLSTEQLFGRFYASPRGRGREPAPETLALFRELLAEAEQP